jgi:hypothetical protein
MEKCFVSYSSNIVTNIYALSDIHRRYDEMLECLSLVNLDTEPDSKLVFLGDYIGT